MASIGRPTAIKYHTGLFLVFTERLGYIDYNYRRNSADDVILSLFA
jgi:hypothetical protein